MNPPLTWRIWIPAYVAGALWLLALTLLLLSAGTLREQRRRNHSRQEQLTRLAPHLDALESYRRAEAAWRAGGDATTNLDRVLADNTAAAPQHHTVHKKALASGGTRYRAELSWDTIDMAALTPLLRALELQPAPWRLVEMTCHATATPGTVRARVAVETLRP